MKKTLFTGWIFICLAFFVSCSDDNGPGEQPAPPTAEYKDGINSFPEEAKATGELEIVFKASSSSPLYGYTGKVYAHIGVIEGGTWNYVPADWEVNIDKCLMTKIDDNVWSLSIAPTIRQWFGVREGDIVQQIGVVFRSEDGQKKGLGDVDSFISVEDESFSIPEITYQPLPEGVELGINIADNGDVTLVLYDEDLNKKHKEFVYLIGDFNNWQLNKEYLMKYDREAGCWWHSLTNLDKNTEYAFQYYVGSLTDGNLRIADPYTEKVLDPLDSYIPASTYPGLRSYPADKTSGVISTFTINQQEYNWQITNFNRPDAHNMIIYEMLFRDFTETGDINGAIARLPYLKSLGVNAIELMPVQEFDGNDSWGYNPCYFFAMDKAYGTKQDYKRFIDECHKLDIAVILDVVYNHATGANPFAKLYWNTSANKTAANNPWFNVDAPHPYSVFHDFNHESELVRTFVKRNLKFLLEEYNVDGFRFDLTKGFTQNRSSESTASNYDASRVSILRDYGQAIKDVDPDACIILEHFADLREEKELAEAGMHLWRNLNNAYCESAMGWPSNSSFEALSTFGTTMPFGGWVGYMESHDEERASFKQTKWGNGVLQTNLDSRMKQLGTNAAFFFTVPGPKMVWQFGEMGYDVSIDENGRTGRKPLHWEYLDNAQRKSLHDTYARLIDFRLSNPELFTPSVTFNWQVKAANWDNGRFITSVSGDKAMVVAGNFTFGESTYTVNFPTIGQWYNVIDGTVLNLTSTTQSITVPAHEFKMYVNFVP